MSENKQQQTGENNRGSNAPTHAAYHIREVNEGKDFWTRIGSAWTHKDGKGFTVQLDALPVDGRLTLRQSEEPAATQPQTGNSKKRHAQPAPT
jgi:hypothetical protein